MWPNALHYPMYAPEKYLNASAICRSAGDGRDDQRRGRRRRRDSRGSGAAGPDGEYADLLSDNDNGLRETRNWLDGTEDPYYGGTAGIFTGHKYSLFEGGIRVPAIVA